MIKHCPTCNRSSEDVAFAGEFCVVCVAERLQKEFRGSATVSWCKRCERVRTPLGHKKLNAANMELAIKKAIHGGYIITVLGFDEKAARTKIVQEVEGKNVAFDKEIALKFVNEICVDCYRKSSGYYEALVQIRGPEDRAKKLADKLSTFMVRRGGFIANTENVDGGIDIFLSDKIATNEFFHKGWMPVKKSYTLYGIKNGRKVYRNVYLVKL